MLQSASGGAARRGIKASEADGCKLPLLAAARLKFSEAEGCKLPLLAAAGWLPGATCWADAVLPSESGERVCRGEALRNKSLRA